MKFKLVDVDFYYNDEPDVKRNYLCAVGEYDENDSDCLEWDDLIFFWFDTLDDLEGSKEYVEEAEFTVVDYQFR